MNNPSGPHPRRVPDSPYYTPQHTTPTALLPRRRGRYRTARPYLARLPEPETLVLPVITEDMAPPAPTTPEYRVVGPWLERHEQTAPTDETADPAALVRPYLTRAVRSTATRGRR